MPFALLIIGLVLIVVGFQDTYEAFFKQVTSDFSGSGSFIYFMAAIFIVGGIGYIPALQNISRAFLALILIALFIGAVNKGGFFGNLSSGLSSGDTGSTDAIGGPLPNPSSGSSGGGGGGSSSGGGGLIDDVLTLGGLI